MTDSIEIETQRLLLRPTGLAEMEALREAEPDPEMRQAYSEMIDKMLALPGREEWACDWAILRWADGQRIGGVGFKGTAGPDGCVELGYGIDAPYRCQGYAAEAAQALADWALAQPEVRHVLAQTEPGNEISQRVLRRCGFVRDGDGPEGPMFRLDAEKEKK